MNGSTGIQPTVELATTNGAYPYAYPMMGYGNGFGNGLFGGEGLWAIILIALIFGGFGNGFGGWGGNNQVATTDFISSEFTQRDITNLGTAVSNGFQNQSNLISNGFADNATNICNLRSDLLTGNMTLQNSIQDAKFASAIGDANTQRDILLQTTQLENQASINALNNMSKMDSCCCELKAQGLENTQRILDALNQNTIADLREKLNEAQTEISNRNIESSIINSVRPYPTPAWLVSSPYQSLFNPYGFNGGFYGNGFYGNTII